MITLNQNEMAAIHAMQNGEHITRQDLVFLDVAATKILANAKDIRKKLGISHPCARNTTEMNLGEKLKLFLAEPKNERELCVFLRAKNKFTMQGMVSNCRRRYKLCFCKVSPNHWQHLPEYDGFDNGPTSFGHFVAIQMIKNGGKLKRETLTSKYGVPKSGTENILALGRKHKERFRAFLELVKQASSTTHSGYKKDLDNVHCAM